jgi:molybdopterin-synthase adenylyltransferase
MPKAFGLQPVPCASILPYTTKQPPFLDGATSIMSKHPATTFEEQPAGIHIGTPADAQSSEIPVPDTAAPAIPASDRYSRQILFHGIQATGQHLLASAHVAIIGIGATGAATASLLARAGVGTLTLIDRDFVEPSNLQRQILFDEADARESLPKAEAARRKIALFNSAVSVHSHIADLVPANIHELLAPHHHIHEDSYT